MDADVGEPTAREVLIALNAHVTGCERMGRINLAFQGAVLAGLMAFAGYTYNQNQQIQQQQIQAQQAALTAIHQTAAEASSETVHALQSPR